MRVLDRLYFSAIVVAAIAAAACGNGDRAPANPPPVITSTPPISASENTPYTYNLAAVDPGGAPVSFSLATAPAGATLSGTTLNWTPAPSQSRQLNEFSVKATTSRGASATQSWTVTPAGTIHVTWVDTIWTQTGAQTTPHDWTRTPPPSAAVLIPQPDGSFLTLNGTGTSDGHLTVPNVPGGYFWLQGSYGAFYWTSSSDIDLGTDLSQPNLPPPLPTTGAITTPVNFNITGFEPGGNAGVEINVAESPFLFLASEYFGNGLNSSFTIQTNSNLDYSQFKSLSAREYKLASFGSVKAFTLGPTAELTNLSLTVGTVNNIDVPLTASSQQSVTLNLHGATWSHLFDKVAPSSATLLGTPFALSVKPYLNSANIRVRTGRGDPELVSSAAELTLLPGSEPFFRRPFSWSCTATFSQIPPSLPVSAMLLQNDESGVLQYGDPYPADSVRQFVACQQATVDLPSLDGNTAANHTVILTNAATFPGSASDISALVGPVESPTVNGQSLFSPVSLSESTQTYTLNWTKPSFGNPTGYTVSVYVPTTLNQRTYYFPQAQLSTTKTTMTLPPGLLQSGKTYYFLITALTDGRANIESSPNRLGFPAGNADIISAPITVSP